MISLTFPDPGAFSGCRFVPQTRDINLDLDYLQVTKIPDEENRLSSFAFDPNTIHFPPRVTFGILTFVSTLSTVNGTIPPNDKPSVKFCITSRPPRLVAFDEKTVFRPSYVMAIGSPCPTGLSPLPKVPLARLSKVTLPLLTSAIKAS